VDTPARRRDGAKANFRGRWAHPTQVNVWSDPVCPLGFSVNVDLIKGSLGIKYKPLQNDLEQRCCTTEKSIKCITIPSEDFSPATVPTGLGLLPMNSKQTLFTPFDSELPNSTTCVSVLHENSQARHRHDHPNVHGASSCVVWDSARFRIVSF
jgi:hypothetical protein